MNTINIAEFKDGSVTRMSSNGNHLQVRLEKTLEFTGSAKGRKTFMGKSATSFDDIRISCLLNIGMITAEEENLEELLEKGMSFQELCEVLGEDADSLDIVQEYSVEPGPGRQPYAKRVDGVLRPVVDEDGKHVYIETYLALKGEGDAYMSKDNVDMESRVVDREIVADAPVTGKKPVGGRVRWHQERS